MISGFPVRIAGTGKYIPEKVMTNFDFEKILDTSDEWIVTRTGIRKRHFAGEGVKCSDLAYKAGLAALEDAGIDASELDLVILATNTPDTVCPSTAAKIQGMLGAVNAGAYDVLAGCTGSLTAMLTAVTGIASGVWKNVLVIGSEDFEDVLDWSDRSTCILFGDGAGAAVLTRSEDGGPRFAAGEVKADGSKYRLITIDKEEGRDNPVLRMHGAEVFKFVNVHLPPFIKSFCEKAGVEPAEIGFWVLHQANTRIIDSLFKRLGVSTERTLMNLEQYGNTSAASLMVTLDEAMKSGSIKSGEKVLFMAFGAGMTLGALLYEA
ncbi:beta-ketoacyl-ACP synthase III [Cloacibacillus sp. An23]|uniref:3-oxoacyl-ACP synthase III family protein n=1 Tax=Cloacibacillus sp. An23 TaxID=1965591 RepID=UPI000B3A0DED|nr:beta-ketoacyl-ACP synthase III [Cloacibacillus sp. An23]OUO95022.1 3-oxoacyl-ACP synthase [Cloacibacillus sp. An23]